MDQRDGLFTGGAVSTRASKFCRCIKSVRKTIKTRKGSTKESGAIAVCTTRLLWPHGKTLRKVRCVKRVQLLTQKRRKQA